MKGRLQREDWIDFQATHKDDLSANTCANVHVLA